MSFLTNVMKAFFHINVVVSVAQHRNGISEQSWDCAKQLNLCCFQQALMFFNVSCGMTKGEKRVLQLFEMFFVLWRGFEDCFFNFPHIFDGMVSVSKHFLNLFQHFWNVFEAFLKSMLSPHGWLHTVQQHLK